ncbi:hypothetical protein LTS08_001394 [Lithohypha guttulata]|nr:hypothetical protein LTS08_001394 [Lithohypha guttulata]
MVQLGLRVVQFLLTLIIMSLVGNMIAEAFGGNPSIINYDMFVAVFSMLTLFYAILICFRESLTFHRLVPASLDLLNALFFFCAAVAMAAELRVHSCSNSDYTENNHITNGSRNTAGRCREAQATTAFLWFNWALYMVALVLSLTSSGGVNLRGPRRGPQMRQV